MTIPRCLKVLSTYFKLQSHFLTYFFLYDQYQTRPSLWVKWKRSQTEILEYFISLKNAIHMKNTFAQIISRKFINKYYTMKWTVSSNSNQCYIPEQPWNSFTRSYDNHSDISRRNATSGLLCIKVKLLIQKLKWNTNLYMFHNDFFSILYNSDRVIICSLKIRKLIFIFQLRLHKISLFMSYQGLLCNFSGVNFTAVTNCWLWYSYLTI